MRKKTKLLSSLKLRTVNFKNRVIISPMQQYAAKRDGCTQNFHKTHYGRLAMGGAALVFTEALCISPGGRLTYSDLGIWNDAHIPGLRKLTKNITALGAIPGAQILHAGRKASVQRPWDGYAPLSNFDIKTRKESPWQVIGPSPIPANPGWPIPLQLTKKRIATIIQKHKSAAARCRQAGFRALNIHGAHGYLIHSFLSPISNTRTDSYGGSLVNRMRLAIEIAEAVRAEWPAKYPLFYRLSCIDGEPGGWSIDDTIKLTTELHKCGVDIIDCSSRGLGQRTTPVIEAREQGFQVPLAEAIRLRSNMPTVAVGMITDPLFAESVLEQGKADLIAIGREALHNPNWPLHAAEILMGDEAFENVWAPRYGWWLSRRAKSIAAELAAKEHSAKQIPNEKTKKNPSK